MKLPLKFICHKLIKVIIFLSIIYLVHDLARWIADDNIEVSEKLLKIEDRPTENPEVNPNSSPLILVWNGYQEDDSLYRTIFKRMSTGFCSYMCRYTRDKSKQNESAAILFHLPNLHWEGYNYPTYRNPSIPWVLMTYESANSVRERASNWGRYPALTSKHINNVFNRTMTLRSDSDVEVRHGYAERRGKPLDTEELGELYSQEVARDFTNYTQHNFGTREQSSAIVWFVSHCKDYDGRMKYVHLLQQFISVDIYGDCGPYQCGQRRSMGHEYRVKEDPCFKMVNRKYRFYLSFENAICKDYVTEKMFNALKLNTIPVVFGGANYSQILPPGSYIDALDFPDPKGTFCSK
jgi:hypothetical protein